MNNKLNSRLGVCSWSLQPQTPADLFRDLEAIGLNSIIIALDPIRENPLWKNYATESAHAGVQNISAMFGTIGEDYTTLDSIRRTGGVVPDEHWDANWRNIQTNALLARSLGIKLVMFHAGFLPHDETDPAFSKLVERLARIADFYGENDLEIAFETGQEDATTLSAFLTELNRKNVFINFDPANLILYDKGDPIAALKTLAPWLRQTHIKDATKTKLPGTWGEEVVVGTGQVDWKAFYQTLDEVGFEGWCFIEREAGSQRVADIRTARDYVKNL